MRQLFPNLRISDFLLIVGLWIAPIIIGKFLQRRAQMKLLRWTYGDES